jgi:hypothetical protein
MMANNVGERAPQFVVRSKRAYMESVAEALLIVFRPRGRASTVRRLMDRGRG